VIQAIIIDRDEPNAFCQYYKISGQCNLTAQIEGVHEKCTVQVIKFRYVTYIQRRFSYQVIFFLIQSYITSLSTNMIQYVGVTTFIL
jgi:hypothetical protein